MTSAAQAAALSVDILIESPLWATEPDCEAVLQRAVNAAAGEASSASSEIAIVLTDDSGIQALNRKWRGRDEPTNVLSFPAHPVSAAGRHLGDIALAFETLAREAKAQGKPFAHHLAHLAVHGYLHLLGYDHDTDREAEAMERFETRILRKLGIPDPYATRGA
jgi:probable rRNA maturation factor